MFDFYLTVSALHARIQKRGGNLLVTDLGFREFVGHRFRQHQWDFYDEKRLRPGVASTVLPGSCVTFGKNF